MGDEKDTPPKTDMTGIFELPQAEALPTDENADPFAVNVMPANEQVDSFESIDQIGMMDHVQPESTPPPSTGESYAASTTDPFASDPFAVTTPDSFASDSSVTEPSVTESFSDDSFARPDALDEIKQYSDHTRGSSHEIPIHHPFHLFLQGQFGPFERDKLLLFITENPIGIASADLDLQIKAGRVLFPRISEYAGIRLIQELRDSGLQFTLKPSQRDDDEPVEHSPALKFQFDGSAHAAHHSAPVVVIATGSALLSLYDEIDSIQTHQFIKAEMIEVERSDLFHEVIERMTESLKQKARAKGAQAITQLEHKINPLRLPSQYQISVSATLLRKKP